MSPSETSVLDQADPLREEDSDLFGAAAVPTPRKPSPGSATSSAAASTPASVSAPAAPAAAAADREASAGAGAAETSGSAAAAIGGAVRPDAAGTSGTSANGTLVAAWGRTYSAFNNQSQLFCTTSLLLSLLLYHMKGILLDTFGGKTLEVRPVVHVQPAVWQLTSN